DKNTDDDDSDQGQAEKPISRAEEVQISKTSPGQVSTTTRPTIISLYNFAIDGAALKPEHRAALAEIADILKGADANKVGVLVKGHADSSGSTAVNKPLSQRRAEAVQRALAQTSGRAVDSGWAGDTEPAASNSTVEGRDRNRRVDIYFLPRG